MKIKYNEPKSIVPFSVMLNEIKFPLTYDEGEYGEYTMRYSDGEIAYMLGQAYCTLNQKQQEIIKRLLREGVKRLNKINDIDEQDNINDEGVIILNGFMD